MNIDNWLKKVWLAIGVILLLVALGGVVLFVLINFPSHHDSGVAVGPEAKPKGPDSLIVQDIRMQTPTPIGRSRFMFMIVEVKNLSQPTSARSMTRISGIEEEPYSGTSLVNIVFMNEDGTSPHLLLEKRALIQSIDIPHPTDSLRAYNLYHIAFFDTDNDGRLSRRDSAQLYISDLDGGRLQCLTPRGAIVRDVEKEPNGNRIFIQLQQKPASGNVAPQDWPERWYCYDVRSRTMSPFPSDSGIREHIMQIMWNK